MAKTKVYIRKAKVNPATAESLPPEFITEYVFENLFSTAHSQLGGWEVVDELSFQSLIADNPNKLATFLAEKAAKLVQEQEAAALSEEALLKANLQAEIEEAELKLARLKALAE